MKRSFFSVIAFCCCVFAAAHPGIGIVKDSKGFIYYTDLENIYRIDPSTQAKTIVVRGVHSHDLMMDRDDNLYGEHLWYIGAGSNRFDHYQWRLRADGRLDTISGPSPAYVTNDFSLCRDAKGNEYRVQALRTDRILKKTPAGQVTTIAEGNYKDVAWMQALDDGNIYFSQKNALYRINGRDSLSLVASGIGNSRASFPTSSGPELYGVWTDNHTNIYIAVFSDRMVKKLLPGGKTVNTYFEKQADWAPVGGVFDKADNLWVLEYSAKNEVRVLKVTESVQQAANIPSSWSMRVQKYWPEFVITAILFIGFASLMIRRTSKQALNKNDNDYG